MDDSRNETMIRRATQFAVVAGVALTLAIGSGQAAGAQVSGGDECQADRSNHLFGGPLTGPLTFVSDLLPFTIAGEQYPVCD